MNQFDPSDVEAARESSRRVLAIIIVAAFALTILASFATIWWVNEGDMTSKADVGLRLTAPLLTIVGTVLGFYFGREDS